ncbi:MAG: 23S rRNA (guanosine(2251)-2'-O)-methyltransferase RlmB [Gammaproteobacteria bacterium]|nr:23S rRNA (guanosine(2251)-2'-O)-methyltransferase RlmB [Gammaproteobacteria bacterium]
MATTENELLYGIHSVRARLRGGSGGIIEMWLLKDISSNKIGQLQQIARKLNIPIVHRSRADLNKQVQGVHQGVVLVCEVQQQRGEEYLEEILRDCNENLLLLVLDGVTDPHNLGACMRNAAAMGVHAVIAPKDRAVGLTPAAVKAASGATERVPFIQVTNLVRSLKWLKQCGVWIIGTAVAGGQPLDKVDLVRSVALVMGAEGSGLRRLTSETCDCLAYIPISREQDSLNVSVAAGICLYEVMRQRRKKGDGGIKF